MYYLYSFYVFVFGLCIGSFVNCLVWRLHKKEKITGRSCCPKCGCKIDWCDNIPLLSFIILKGKCRHCKEKISWQYPTVELVTGFLFTLAFYVHYGNFIFGLEQFSIFVRDLFLIFVMIIIFIYDLRWYLILDIVTLPACAVIYLTNVFLLGYDWKTYLVSGFVGASFFLLQFLISKGKWIGGGDIRLGFLMGLALGWPGIVVSIFISYFIGSIVSIGLIFGGKKKWGSEIPLGIFLSVGTIITLFWGETIISKYLFYLGI